MIISEITSLAPYRSISENMGKALNYLENIDFATLQDGKHIIEADDIYIIVSSYETREHEESNYEVHRNYIDIQCLITGEEIIFVNDLKKMESEDEYNPSSDKLNLKSEEGEFSIHLKPGIAAIFFPHDAHKACCKVNKRKEQVRKLVIKVKI